MDKYIVILNGGQGRPAFLVDEKDEACLFDTKLEAERNAVKNPMGKARGFEVIPWHSFEG